MVRMPNDPMTRFGALLAVCSLALAASWPAAAQTENVSGSVSSGSFYEAVVQFYYRDRPAHFNVPNGDVEAFFALPVFVPAIHTYTDEYGRESDIEKRRKRLKSLFARQAKRGSQ